jgi:acyl dehydratase
MTPTVGQVYKEQFVITQDQVKIFAEITGDDNPLHLDDEFASTTIFKKKIVHGFLGGAFFSKILGTRFPGPGTIYLGQTMKFLAPMFVNQHYEARVQVTEIQKEKARLKLSTIVVNVSDESKVIEGEALVQNNSLTF